MLYAQIILRKFEKLTEKVLEQARFVEDNKEEVKSFLTEAIVDSFIKDMNVESLDDKTMEKLFECTYYGTGVDF